MKPKKILLTFLIAGTIIFCGFTSKSTLPPTLHKTMSATSATFDMQVWHYMNQLRKDPPGFYHKYVEKYIEQKKSRFTSYYTRSLKQTLLKLKPLPSFQNSSTLNAIASKQLHYLIHTLKGKRLSHDQGNISFSERIKGSGLHCFAENLYRFPNSTPLEVVIDLLIDQGVSSLGHRKNFLNPMYNRVSIQTATAPNNYRVTVIDFSCKK